MLPTRWTLALTTAACLLSAAAPAAANFEWLGKIDAAADGLEDPDSSARLEAVKRLARFDIHWTKSYLLKALDDRSPDVRIAAGRLLGSHGISSAAPRIASWLTDPDADTRTAAAEILGQLEARSASTALIRALGDPDDKVRAQAVTALGEIGVVDAVIPAIGRLEDEKSTVRLAAVRALAKLGDPRAVVQLVGTFDDSSLDIRREAIKAVGALGDDAAVPALLRLLRDRAVRTAAAAALGDLAAARSTPALIEALREERSDNSFRAVVATSLGRVARARRDQSQEASRALVSALADPQLRKAAREALGIAGRVAVPAFIAHLEGRLPGDPQTVVELLGELGDPRATPALIRELERGRLDRSLILSALSRSGDDKALVPIIGLLRDPDPEVRLAAMQALEPLIQGDSRAADVVVELLDDDSEEIRVLAAGYLGVMKAAVAIEPLVATAADADAPTRVRAAALGALGAIGDSRGTDVALKVLAGRDDELKRPAATALMFIAPASAEARLLSLATGRDARGRTISTGGQSRLQALRALAAVVRGRPSQSARTALVRLARRGPALSSLAALDALGAMADPRTRKVLEDLARHPDPMRRAAALDALAQLDGSAEIFARELGSRDDRVAGAAARALVRRGVAGQLPAVLELAERGGFAAQINASAALARHMPASYSARVRKLLYHRLAPVRANAVFALGRVKAAGSRDALIRLLEGDDSWLVRTAAARALSRIGGARGALKKAAESDSDERVTTEARRALEVVFAPAPPSEWRSFYFVDPTTNYGPVIGEPYVIVGSDGVALAVYSDARGEALIERFVPGEHIVKPADRLSEL